MKLLGTAGNILLVLGLVLFIVIFWPVAKEEIKYNIENLTDVHYSLEPKEGSSEKTDRGEDVANLLEEIVLKRS